MSKRDVPLVMGAFTGFFALVFGIMSDNPNTWTLNFPLGFAVGYVMGWVAYWGFRK